MDPIKLSAPQYEFLSSPAEWVAYGGAAGGGKTFSILLDPLRHCQGEYAQPFFRGVILRKTFPQIMKSGGLYDESSKIYSYLNANFNHTRSEWTFPCGAKINLDVIQADRDLDNFQGAQLSYVAFDEATQFPLKHVLYLWGRVRSKAGIPGCLRLTANPDNDSWLYKLIHWWIDPTTGFPIKERSGKIRHFTVVDGDNFVWFDEPQYEVNPDTGEQQKTTVSFTFIPATLDDNKALTTADPSYRARLMQLSDNERERYLSGCWLAAATTDTEWPRDWFIDLFVDDSEYPPPYSEAIGNRQCVRMFAIDPSKGRNPRKGDYSAIVCSAVTSDLTYVDSDIRRRPPSQIVEDLFAFCEHPLHRIGPGDLIGIESLQFQSLFRDMILNYAKDHPQMALAIYLAAGNILIPVEDPLPKPLRIRRLDPRLRARKFRFLRNPSNSILLMQLKQFNGRNEQGQHDDGPDALDMTLQLPIQLENYYKRLAEGKTS